MITKSIKNTVLTLVVGCGCAVTLTSCSDLMDTDSELVEFQEDNTLQERTDSVYSIMGIIYKLQAIADRTVLLGELRGDLTTYTPSASKDLKDIVNFEVNTDNAYNRISDYYAVINNCNYFLTHVNTNLEKNGKKVFEGEYVVAKTYRAWTYLQLAMIYGQVPLVTEPLLTEEAAQAAMKQTPVNITAICNYFINDLKPYVDTKLPNYRNINNRNSQKFFIPVRVLLGDLCLWAGLYQDAAQYYHDYLSLRTDPVPTGKEHASWYDADTREFRTISNSLNYGPSSSECLCYIPMEDSEFYGIKSELTDIFSSTELNRQYAKVMPTMQLRTISAAQKYCTTIVPYTGATPDTIYAPTENLERPELLGDLRFGAVYMYNVYKKERYARTSNERQTIDKFSRGSVNLYRRNMVYLRYAEALNRARCPQSAFAVLKYGLNPNTISKYVDSTEVAYAGTLIDFDATYFTDDNTQGIHSRGSGSADCDTLYRMPQPVAALPTRKDTVDYQIPFVENMIVNEMALEGAFEGYRFYDLMRVAIRRNDNSYLALPVSSRDGSVDAALYSKLMVRSNWYLPKP